MELICVLFQTEHRIKGPLNPSDPELIRLIREKYLFSPSIQPYNLTYTKKWKKSYPSYSFIASFIAQLYPKPYKGFFVEAGALDGEYMSHTLDLEMVNGWTGLLVEPDPMNFNKLRQKHRRAWKTPVCFSIHDYPEEVIMRRNVDPIYLNVIFNKATLRILEVTH